MPAEIVPDPAPSAVARDVASRRAIEAILMAATEPVEPGELAQLLEIPTADVVVHCTALALEYERGRRGFELRAVPGGYRYQTHPDLAPYVERFVLEGRQSRLSRAALETLAIVAYRQPVSRAQIAAIRGVNVDATMRTLVSRGYVTDVGTDPGPGQAVLFGTTEAFLDRLGLDSLADLEPLADFVPDASMVETIERGLRLPLDAET